MKINNLSHEEKGLYLNSKRFGKVFENTLLNAALFYASLDYRVFPLQTIITENNFVRCSCQNWKDCENQGKHPRNRKGHLEATTDEKRITEWWTKHPDSNIGLLTGKASEMFVLDIDVKSGGEMSLENLQEDYKLLLKDKYVPLPGTLTTFSGSGGRHLYFKFPFDKNDISSSASEIADGLDIRANGGYIIAPPSNHKSGKFYRWFGVDTPIEDAPNWLIYEIVKPGKEKKSKRKECAAASASNSAPNDIIKKGKRQDYLFRYICGLVNSFPETEVLKRALKKNTEILSPPFSEKDIKYHVQYLHKKFGKKSNPLF